MIVVTVIAMRSGGELHFILEFASNVGIGQHPLESNAISVGETKGVDAKGVGPGNCREGAAKVKLATKNQNEGCEGKTPSRYLCGNKKYR